jgi:predicted AAA+ superfamily ATPase
MKLIERKQYLKKMIDTIGTPDIKVISGIRRSGKSKLLEAFVQYLDQNVPNANTIHINFNLPEFDELLKWKNLYDFIRARHLKGKDNFVLIDEVQMCDGFERAISGLHASELFNIYITGSNAFLLSSDLATLFTGRTHEIKVYPFSFGEYTKYYAYTDPYVAFEKYILEGGMAGSYPYTNQEDKLDYIKDVFDTLIVRDIRQKYKIRNTTLMDRIADFLMDNISNIVSSRSIAETLSGKDYEANHKTIGQYMRYLCNAYAFYKVKRYDIRGKRYLVSDDKYYLSDHSFRYAKLGTKNMDWGRAIENIVAMELFRQGYEVYVGVLYKKEIDFVAIKRSEKLYIQVSDSIADEKTFQREVTSLLGIKDAYPKLLLARTRHKEYQYEGIRIIDVADWILSFYM